MQTWSRTYFPPGVLILKHPLDSTVISTHLYDVYFSQGTSLSLYDMPRDAPEQVDNFVYFSSSRSMSLAQYVPEMEVMGYDFTFEIWINDANEPNFYFIAYVMFNYECAIWYDASSAGIAY